jgi:hypothetical protein
LFRWNLNRNQINKHNHQSDAFTHAVACTHWIMFFATVYTNFCLCSQLICQFLKFCMEYHCHGYVHFGLNDHEFTLFCPFHIPLPYSVPISTSLIPTTHLYLFQHPWCRWIRTTIISNFFYIYILIVTPGYINRGYCIISLTFYLLTSSL